MLQICLIVAVFSIRLVTLTSRYRHGTILLECGCFVCYACLSHPAGTGHGSVSIRCEDLLGK
jgi:hypothetical protein